MTKQNIYFNFYTNYYRYFKLAISWSTTMLKQAMYTSTGHDLSHYVSKQAIYTSTGHELCIVNYDVKTGYLY